MSDDEKTVGVDAAARFLRVTTRTLQSWHRGRTGPRCALIGGKLLYRQSDLDAYFEQNSKTGEDGER